MNALGLALVWLALQVSVLSAIASVVYLLVRRGSPLSGASAALAGLLLTALLSAVSLSPWPDWSFETAPPRTVASVAEREIPNPEPSPADLDTTAATGWSRVVPGLTDLWMQLDAQALQTTSHTLSDRLQWSGWVAVLFLIGALFAFSRLLMGLMVVGQHRNRSRSITDPVMLGEVDVLCAELKCRQTIALRESEGLVSAATIGWRKPVILLPPEWKSWTESERRSVLAHEIAHIHHRDFLFWLCAQTGLLLHFYHPLVHWLANRLRLEQELAADALAAECSGGASPYLRTLAELALRQADRPVAWPARTFLPVRGTLMRRVEMLRDSRFRPAPSLWRRTIALLTLCSAALCLAGLRPPEGHTLLAQDTAGKQKDAARKNDAAQKDTSGSRSDGSRLTPAEAFQQSLRNQLAALTGQGDAGTAAARAEPGFDLSLVPSNTTMLIGMRPASIMASPGLSPLVPPINQMLEREMSLKVELIEQLLVLGIPGQRPQDPIGPEPTMVIRMTQPYSFDGTMQKYLREGASDSTLQGKPVRINGMKVAWQADDRTLVIGHDSGVKNIMDQTAGKKPAWSDSFETIRSSSFAYVVDMQAVRPMMQQQMNRGRSSLGPMEGAIGPLWQDSKLVMVSGTLAPKALLTVTFIASNAEGATRIEQTAQGLIPLARNMFQNLTSQAGTELSPPPGAPPQAAQLVSQATTIGKTLLDSLKVSRNHEAGSVSITAELGAEEMSSAPILVGLLLPAIQQSREAAQRAQNMNNLKQLALALHNYHDSHGHFPPPVLIGPDGKTPHSWRVALLPYLEQQALYTQYKLDEPWDSTNNLRILASMPPVLRHPSEPGGTTSTSYYALTGPDTLMGPVDGKGTKITDIVDGTSNTIALVEAKRGIPWTKPEDIPFDKDQPVPNLGGYTAGGPVVCYGDGSVRVLRSTTAEALLKALITRSGGEVIPNEF